MDDDDVCQVAEIGGGILISIFLSSDDPDACNDLQERFERGKMTVNELIKEGKDLVNDTGKKNLAQARNRALEEGIDLDMKLAPNWRKCLKK
jgi:hypothetical protein